MGREWYRGLELAQDRRLASDLHHSGLSTALKLSSQSLQHPVSADTASFREFPVTAFIPQHWNLILLFGVSVCGVRWTSGIPLLLP